MNKPVFITAINQATLLQNCYTDKKRMLAMWDILYDELSGEDEKDVLAALKRIGRSDKTINYFNIKAFIDEGNPVKVWKDTATKYEPMPDEAKKAIAELHKKFK